MAVEKRGIYKDSGERPSGAHAVLFRSPEQSVVSTQCIYGPIHSAWNGYNIKSDGLRTELSGERKEARVVETRRIHSEEEERNGGTRHCPRAREGQDYSEAASLSLSLLRKFKG